MRKLVTVLAALAAATVLTAATGAFSWWQIGDQSTVPLSAAPDYAMTPPAISAATEQLLGLAGAVVAILLVVGLAWATGVRRVSATWWLIAFPALVAGYLLALTGRTMTAGVIGANIGAGLALFVFGPIVLALALWILGWAIGLVAKNRIRPRTAAPEPA